MRSTSRERALPDLLRPLFWDYDFDRLTWPAGRDLVTARVLQNGGDDAVRWLRQKTGEFELAAWIRDRRGRGLDPRRLRFWQLVLDLPQDQVIAGLRRRGGRMDGEDMMSAYQEHVLTAAQQRLLKGLGPAAEELGFYLAGGTAVALRLGHRRSEDFDWFSADPRWFRTCCCRTWRTATSWLRPSRYPLGRCSATLTVSG